MEVYQSDHLNNSMTSFLIVLNKYLKPLNLFIKKISQIVINFKKKTTLLIIIFTDMATFTTYIKCSVVFTPYGPGIFDTAEDIKNILSDQNNQEISDAFKYFTCDLRKYRNKIIEILSHNPITHEKMSLCINNS